MQIESFRILKGPSMASLTGCPFPLVGAAIENEEK